MFLTAAKWAWVFPPIGWTWPNVISVGISLVAIVLSVLTFRQRIRYHPQPKLVAEWIAHTPERKNPLEAPYASLWVLNHGDAPARDVRVWVSTRPEASGGPFFSAPVFEPGSPLGHIEAPFTKQVTEELNEYIDYVWKMTVPLDQVKFERPVVTIRWRQPPFHRRPKKKTFKVPKDMFTTP